MRVLIKLFFIFTILIFLGCSIGVRVETTPENDDNIVVTKTATRIYIGHYTRKTLTMTYIHFLETDPMSKSYQACLNMVFFRKQNRSNVLQKMCVDKNLEVLHVEILDIERKVYDCGFRKNLGLCLFMQERFRTAHQKLEVDRHIKEMSYFRAEENHQGKRNK